MRGDRVERANPREFHRAVQHQAVDTESPDGIEYRQPSELTGGQRRPGANRVTLAGHENVRCVAVGPVACVGLGDAPLDTARGPPDRTGTGAAGI
ncbi:MAG TPA: hypothetical protein VN787_02160 [Steroidobacteraceae bacterium]|nr:hypothetical protein [Steroidobacteraceae bacterium]